MDKFLVTGGTPLVGTIRVSGAKNAALPCMAAAILTEDEVVLENIPHVRDIDTERRLLASMGGEVEIVDDGTNRTTRISCATLSDPVAKYEIVKTMRASSLVLGPLIARTGMARVAMPGGCAIGGRPIDLHIKGLEKMGAVIVQEHGYLEARADQLKGTHLVFDKITVTGTEDLLMAAVLAEGETVLVNAAREPEIVDLAHCLVAMGAHIEGIGSDRLTVQGVASLHGARHTVIPDRIETGTYVMAAAATGGDVLLLGARLEHIEAVAQALETAGVSLTETAEGVRVSRRNGRIDGVDVMSEPYPGFPTDLQAQVMALMTIADGAAMITETIFENRFMHVPELMRMGANINVHGSSALVRGVERLTGAPVMATDLRASVSLVVAGLVAEGETVINRVYHLDRGYERLEEKLAACGARIERLRGGS
jgi:UDP-N-acetylglucosamine 1-carboxyvinyltransferase